MAEESGFAQRIRDLRTRRGISQEQLADLIRVSVMTVRRWEWGERVPRLEEIKRLAEVLEVPVEKLLNNSASQTWELRLVVNKTGNETQGGIIDMTGTGSAATLSVGDNAMGITLSAPYELWEDNASFEALIEDLRRKRQAGLKMRKENW